MVVGELLREKTSLFGIHSDYGLPPIIKEGKGLSAGAVALYSSFGGALM